MDPILVAVLGLAGLLIGWGLRAVIAGYTVPAGEPAQPCCPVLAAQRTVMLLSARPGGWYPVCHQRPGPPVLAVEAVTAILLGAVAARIQPGLVFAAACWLALCTIPLAFIDAAVQRLPDLLTFAAYAGTVLLLLAAAAASGHWPTLVRAVLGGITLAGLYLALTFINPSGMGLGDSKAAASLGTLLAWAGWRTLLTGTFAGFLLAAIYGVALLASGRATRKQHIPFGPFMIAGAFAVVLATGV